MINRSDSGPGRRKNPRARSDAYWDIFIADAVRLGAPLYVELSQSIRRDEELLVLAELARMGQPPANMLLGAVHYLLLRGAQHELRTYYATLGGNTAPHSAYPVFKSFCRTHRDALAHLIATRATNTNEVGRCVYLLPAFVTLAQQAPPPLYMIDIGASAGLNLYWDTYRYSYVTDAIAAAAGDPEAAVLVETRVHGAVPPLGPIPPLGSRVGIDREPVDLSADDQRDWLRALVWPDHPARLKRLETAIEALPERPNIRSGDALAILPEVLAGAPRDGTVCVVHTMTTYQFSRDEREGLDALLTVASLRRPLWRLAMEFEGDSFPLTLSRYADGVANKRLLALGTGHGSEIEWRG